MKNIYLIIYALCCAFVVSGCDFLDVNPKTQVPADKMFSQEAGFEDALNGCYMKMNSKHLYGRFLTLSGVDFLAGYYDKTTSGTLEHALSNFEFENSYLKSQIKSTYNEFYNVILQINDVIVHLDSEEGRNVVKSPEKRALLMGEALALRAFLHFDILRLFGQVPQNATITVSLPYSEVTGVQARPLYGFEEYLAKVMKDIEDAEELLKDDPCRKYNLNTHVHAEVEDDFYHYRKFRFNYYALKALKARIYLYTGDRQNAYKEAMGIINAKNQDGSDYFTLAGDNDFNRSYFALPSETIMGLSNRALDNNETERLFKNESNAFPMLFSKSRCEMMFFFNTASNNRFNRWWGEVTNGTGGLNPYYKKYMQNEGVADDAVKLDNKWLVPLFRLSEMYLIAMESTDDLAEANALYTKYMRARNVQVENYFPDLSWVQVETVFEMRIEFMAEGQMFYTYKRTGATDMFFDNSKTITEDNYVVPVPESELKQTNQ